MLRIALDIDNTLYATDIVKQQIYAEARLAYTDIFERIRYTDKCLDNIYNWFNPDFLIPDALKVLRPLEAELYICTARYVDTKYYDTLFKDSGLTFTAIIQRDSYSSKAAACLSKGIDILVDDDYDNLREHCYLKQTNPDYKTHFVYYTGHTTDPFEPNECLDSVTVMTDWNDFPNILRRINL